MRKYLLTLVGLSLLVACNQDAEETGGDEEQQEDLTVAELMALIEENHGQLESLEVAFNHTGMYGMQKEGVASYDFTNGVTHIEEEYGTIAYKDSEDFMYISEMSYQDEEEEEKILDGWREEHQNPIAYFKQFDEAFFERFDLTDNDGSYRLTYNGDEEAQELLVPAFAREFIESAAFIISEEPEDVPLDQATINAFELSFDVDEDTNRIMSYQYVADYELRVQSYEQEMEIEGSHLFSLFDEVAAIEKPDKDLVAVGNLSYDQQEQYEQESQDYVDALIQAGVFQNVDEYVERVPGEEEEDEKRASGEDYQQSFRDEFQLGLSLGFEGLDLSDEIINDYADAFLSQFAKTNYLILDSSAMSEDTFMVEVSIEGLDMLAIDRELDLLLTEELSNGNYDENITEEELISVLVEVMDRIDGESLMPAREVTVEVNRAGGGYLLLDEEPLIGAFIQ
ncbi:antigen 332 [Bacillus sp. JCM 19046]|nr:antigen 332 [Bacillus sp. JCM 19046]